MKKTISLILCAAIIAAFFSGTSRAQGAYDRSIFSNRDMEQTVSLTDAVAIALKETTAECDSSAVRIEGSTITITDEGIYTVSGVLMDGQIIIDAEKTDKIQLILNGAQIASASSAPIYASHADKVFITLVGDNLLANGGSYIPIDDNNIDSVIFSKADLTLNGTGKLTIKAMAGHGIVSKDSLIITGGTYTINAAEHGICGKDCIAIADSNFTISAGGDGIHAKNTDDASLGYLYIAGGSFLIASGDDGLSATGDLQIDGGYFEITTDGGSENATMKSSDAFGQRGGWFTQSAPAEDTGSSGKGIRADGSILIQDGSFHLDCADDAVHGGSSITISGGSWKITTADDAIHADSNVLIADGTFSISRCYEGIEGENVTVSGGTIDIVSSDDGINASVGADGSGMRGMGQFGSGNASIVISGGSITIVSDGDSLDSNGSITLSGGTLNLTCNGYGNTAIDYDGSYENNGADVTTNDGSENGSGQMHGMGGRGQFGSMQPGSRGQRPEGDMGGFGRFPRSVG